MNTQIPAKDTSCSGRWEVSRTSHETRPRRAARARALQGRDRQPSRLASPPPLHKGTQGPRERALRAGGRRELCDLTQTSLSGSSVLTGKMKPKPCISADCRED